jgi:hypothetical protein
MTFLGTFFVLQIAMSYSLSSIIVTGSGANAPTGFDPQQILAMNFSSTHNFTLPNYDSTFDFDLGSLKFRVHIGTAPFGALPFTVGFQHLATWIITYPDGNYEMYLTSDSTSYGTSIQNTDLDALFNQNKSLKFTLRFQELATTFWLSYNTTKYSNVTAAWQGNELYGLVGASWDQAQTSYNAWDLIGGLLFYKMPDVDYTIDLLMKIPIWSCIAYVAYILILRAIGAVFGGGGS